MVVERNGGEVGMERARRAGVEVRDAPGTRRAALRSILACALAVAAGATAPAAAQRRPRRLELPAATDLAADGAAAARARIPMLLFFDRGDCPYCERALREFLVPMAADASWRDRAIYRQVEIDRATPVVDFAGAATTHAALAARYHAALAPTVLVVDPRGEPLGSPLVGLLTVDFYASYLEAAVDAGLRRLRG
jgi:thioredoxin-related protein